jgi:predicted PurR-regulated permease PerM
VDILRNLFGSLASGIIRLLVTVGIIAAAYFFILKPVLKSADNAVNKTSSSFEQSLGKAGLNDIGKTLESVDKQVQVQIERSFHVAKKNGNPKKLVRCVERADGNVRRIRRCTVKF